MYSLVDRFFSIFIDHWRVKLLIICTIYVVLAILLFQSSPIRYIYLKNVPIQKTATAAMQPFMNIFLGGKVTHYYSFDHIEEPKSLNFLKIYSKTSDRNSENKTVRFFQSIYFGFENNKNTVTIEPENYDGLWVFAFCDGANFCKQSNIAFRGKVKFLNDEKTKIWAFKVDENGKVGEAVTVRIVGGGDQDKDVLYV